ncbi:hypothetical protein [Pseudomonas sp. 910_21]|uniref:hypothetical protein n=1 Tax=Pseudomonas sp. 910_21 TaxID=2604460 RepID=UPI004064BAA8
MPTETQHLEQRVAALQSDLNTKDEQIDALTLSDNDRELSRRSWLDEAKRLEKEVEELRAEVKRLDLMGAQSDYNYDQRRAQFDRVLAERDALLRDVVDGKHATPGWNQRMKAALSASAEPSAPKCGQCGARTVETCNDNGCAYLENGNGAPVERDERAAFEVHPRFKGMDFTRAPQHPDYYESPYANGCWHGWQARAALDKATEDANRG